MPGVLKFVNSIKQHPIFDTDPHGLFNSFASFFPQRKKGALPFSESAPW